MKNFYGLDTNYLEGKLKIFLRDIESHSPEEAARVLVRLAMVASEDAVMNELKSEPTQPTDTEMLKEVTK